MLKPEDFKDKLGVRYTISNGDLIESDEGEFTCSRNFSLGNIYLSENTVYLIPIDYKGYQYKLRQTDCVSLSAKWLKDNLGFDLVDYYKKYDKQKFTEYHRKGMVSFFEDSSDKFKRVTFEEVTKGDILVYSYNDVAVSHIGIYLGDNKILHHMPKKLSCVDDIDVEKVLGVFRVL